MSEDDKKNGEKMDEKRNEKGQFEKGYGGGPGRGHKKESPVILDGELLNMIEEVVITGLGARDLKDRLKAAGIGIRVQGMKGSDDTDTKPEPFVIKIITLLSLFQVLYCFGSTGFIVIIFHHFAAFIHPCGQ